LTLKWYVLLSEPMKDEKAGMISFVLAGSEESAKAKDTMAKKYGRNIDKVQTLSDYLLSLPKEEREEALEQFFSNTGKNVEQDKLRQGKLSVDKYVKTT